MEPDTLPGLAVVQFAARPGMSAVEFESCLRERSRRAAGLGAELVVLPGYTGLCLFPETWRFGDQINPDWRWTYLDVAARVARDVSVYLVPGSLIEPAADSWVHACYLLTPGGEVIARRDQIHVSPWEQSWGLVGGNGLDVVETPWGATGFLLATDLRYPEVGRILGFQGARLMLAPAAHPGPLEQWRQVAGAWREAQANDVYVAEACLQGEVGGVAFAGRSAIYGPNELTPGERGYLGEAAGAGEEIVFVQPDAAFRQRERRYRGLELMQADVYAGPINAAYSRVRRSNR